MFEKNQPLLSIGFQSIIADVSTACPYVLYREGILLVSWTFTDTNSGKLRPEVLRLCHNHIRRLAESLISRDKSKYSLTSMLFGTTAFRSPLCFKKPLFSPAKCNIPVATGILPHGPMRMKVESYSSKALGSLFKKKMVKDSEKYPIIRTEKNIFPRVVRGRYKFQDPKELRVKRFQLFFGKQDYKVPSVDFSSTLSYSRSPQSIPVEVISRSAGTGVGDSDSPSIPSTLPELLSAKEPDSNSFAEETLVNYRTNRPTSALSKQGYAIMNNKRRPVSASVLAMRLPLHHPLSDSHHELTVVLSPKCKSNRIHPRDIHADAKKKICSMSSPIKQNRRIGRWIDSLSVHYSMLDPSSV